KLKAAVGKLEKAGKQPNIVFIMGDDIGYFNISAYHQGVMSGKTPHTDKVAREGMRFTDYYAEASCTAERANFIRGQLPIRPGVTGGGAGGGRGGHPRRGLHAGHGAADDGLPVRSVRQEPPGRPEQVSANPARVPRILRLPVSSRRHVGPLLALLPARPRLPR